MSRKSMSPLAMYRMSRGLQQKDLARLMRVEPSTVHAWEAGKWRPEPDRVPALAHHLGIDPVRVCELVNESTTRYGEGAS